MFFMSMCKNIELKYTKMLTLGTDSFQIVDFFSEVNQYDFKSKNESKKFK